MPERAKILLADDHQIFLESMSMLLDTIDGIELVGTAANGLEVLKKLQDLPVDILICDYMMPEMNGVELTFKVRQQYPHTKVLMLTSREDFDGIKSAIQAGVKGFISKKTNKAELHKAITALSNGSTYYSPEVMQVLVNEPFNDKTIDTPDVLSPREIEILKLIAQELSGVQIAEQLFLSHHTVESHRKNLFRKLGVNSTYALIKYAIRHGLTPQN